MQWQVVRQVSLSISVVVSLGFLCVSVDALCADDWPQWRGMHNDGKGVSTKLPSVWSKTENVHWRTRLPGRGGATPCTWGEHVFVTSNDGTDLVLLCISLDDGAIAWRQTVCSGNQDARAGEGNSASPSPITDGKHVWVCFGTGILACFSVDGSHVWAMDLNERFGKIDIQFGMTSTPVLDGEFLYLQLIHGPMKMDDPSRTGKVIKLNKSTGKTLWAIDRETEALFECKHSYASPFIYRDENRSFLVVHGADCTTGHDLGNGSEIWRFGGLNGPSAVNPKPYNMTFRLVASPGVVPGAIIIPTCKKGPCVGLRVTDELVGECSNKQSILRWVNPITPDVSTPLIHDGLVYLLHKDGKLQCVDLESGEDVYLERTHTGQHRTSPLLVNNKLYFGSNDGWVSVVQAGRTFQLLHSIDIGEAISASLLVAHDTLLMRTSEALYAIRTK